MPAYMEEWTASAGKDNFSNDPPNATLSVYEGGKAENTLAVVEISHPVVEGKDLVYRYKLIEGAMPKSGGATALFIDWICVVGASGLVFTASGSALAGLAGGNAVEDSPPRSP